MGVISSVKMACKWGTLIRISGIVRWRLGPRRRKGIRHVWVLANRFITNEQHDNLKQEDGDVHKGDKILWRWLQAPNEVEEEHVRGFKWLEEVPPDRPEMDEYQAEQEYPQAHGGINIFQLAELDLCDASNEEANHVWIEKVGIGDEDFQKVVKRLDGMLALSMSVHDIFSCL